MQCEDEEEEGLLNSTNIKQLRLAMSIFSPRLLTTLRYLRRFLHRTELTFSIATRHL